MKLMRRSKKGIGRSVRWQGTIMAGYRLLLVVLFIGLLVETAAAAQIARVPPSAGAPDERSSVPTRLQPVYRIPVRVHLGESDRPAEAFLPILEEINEIWLTQAGICFEMQAVRTEEPLPDGMDIWFLPDLPGGKGLNGYYRSDHMIQVRDTPDLGPAEHPAHYPAARTAAHELGHGLGLPHRQDSDDNLMRSKTYGWQLNREEVEEARTAAEQKALPDRTERRCSEPLIVR